MGKRKGRFMGNLKGIVLFPAMSIVIYGIAWGIFTYGSDFGFTPVMGGKVLTVLPALLLSGFGLWMAVESTNPYFAGGTLMIVGLILSYLIKMLYDVGVFTDATFSPGTIWGAQILTVVVLTLAGFIVMIIKRRSK